ACCNRASISTSGPGWTTKCRARLSGTQARSARGGDSPSPGAPGLFRNLIQTGWRERGEAFRRRGAKAESLLVCRAFGQGARWPQAFPLRQPADPLHEATDLAVGDAQPGGDLDVVVPFHTHFQDATVLRPQLGEEVFE